MPNTTKTIPPTDSIKNYLNEALNLYELQHVRKIEGSRSGVREQRRIDNNREAKVRAMDNLFESIANLTYFFQFVNNHPELVSKFKEDIEDIMGEITKSHLHIDSKKSPLGRLIRELIGIQYTDGNFGYRTRVLHMLQFLINSKSDQIMMKLGETPTMNDWQMRAMLGSDMRRAQTWVGYLDKYVLDKEREPGRIIDISKN